MPRLYFQENREVSYARPGDFVIPFWKGEGHNRFADAAPPEIYEEIYNTLYSRWIEWLDQESETFQYRGVNILRSLKYLVFVHALYATILHRAFQKEIQSCPKSEIVLDARNQDLCEARLKEILNFSSMRPIFSENQIQPSLFVPAKKPLKNLFWPKSIRWGAIQKNDVVLYADVFKFENLIQELGSSRLTVYSTERAPKVFSKCLNIGASFYQMAGPTKYGHHTKTDFYVSLLDSIKPFKFQIDGFDVGAFCVWRLKRFASYYINEMLTQADEAHNFFQTSKSLRSALLDEDISLKKNIFCQVATQYRVKTFVQTHGALGEKIGFLPLTADKIFVWGRTPRQKIEQWGCEPSRALVSGCSWYPKYLAMNAVKVREKVSGVFGFDLKKPLVVMALHTRNVFCFPYDNVISQTIEWLLRRIEHNPRCQFIIKLHHSESCINHYEQWLALRGLDSRVAITKTYNPYLLALAADVVVSQHSTYAVDAFVLGKPVICPRDRFIRSCVSEFEPYGIFWNVFNEEDFQKSLDEALELQLVIPADKRKKALEEGLNIGDNIPSATRIIATHLLNRENT